MQITTKAQKLFNVNKVKETTETRVDYFAQTKTDEKKRNKMRRKHTQKKAINFKSGGNK